MSNAPVYNMRANAPLAYVPQLGATLLTWRDDIFENEKKTEIFSSDHPDGLMTRLMGQNMMRKDGPAHMAERKAIFPTLPARGPGVASWNLNAQLRRACRMGPARLPKERE